MNIKTKFDPTDKIFFLHNKKVLQNTVRGVDIKVLPIEGGIGEIEITYLCEKEPAGTANVYIKVSEDDAFESKEALLKSL